MLCLIHYHKIGINYTQGGLHMDSEGSMGIIYNISEGIMKFLTINLIWILFNVPIVFFLINLLIVKDTNGFIAISIILLLLMPFFFFPATTGMFAVMRKWIMKEREIPVLRTFWRHYKENYIKSMMGGLIIEVIWIIFAVDYYFFTIYVSKFFSYLFIFIFIYLLVFTLHFFSTIVHFESRLFNSLKNSMLITIGSPILSFGLGILNGLIIFISFRYLTFLIPLFTGAVIAFVSYLGFYKVYLKLQLLREEEKI